MGPVCIPELTARLQNPQVQYSPGYQHLEPSPPKRGPTHLNLLTNLHSWYPREYQLEST